MGQENGPVSNGPSVSITAGQFAQHPFGHLPHILHALAQIIVGNGREHILHVTYRPFQSPFGVDSDGDMIQSPLAELAVLQHHQMRGDYG